MTEVWRTISVYRDYCEKSVTEKAELINESSRLEPNVCVFIYLFFIYNSIKHFSV